MHYARWYTRWLAWYLRLMMRELWDSIPGPWPVKVAVCLVLLACLAIPGPVDEALVIGAIKGFAYLRKRRMARLDG